MNDKWEQYRANRIQKPPQDKWEQYRADKAIKKEETEEEPSFAKRIARDLGIGFGKMGHTLLNTPHDIAQGLEDASNYLNENFPNSLGLKPPENPVFKNTGLGDIVPKLQEKEPNFADILGQKGEPETADWLLQKGAEHLPDILGALSLYKSLPIALTRRGAAKELRQAQKLASERGIKNLNISSDILEDIPQFLPKTKAYENLLKEAKLGNYEPIFALQSDLGKASSGFHKSPFFAERRHGKEAGKIREQLLNAFRAELEKQGHTDVAELMKKGQNRYRNYNKLKPIRNVGYGLAASQTPYGKKILKGIGIID